MKFKAFASLLGLLACLIVLPVQAAAETQSGTWTKKSFKISGEWTIEDNTLSLTDFKTRNAPDLRIFLSPLSVEELKNENATQGSLLITELPKNKGDQSFTLPEDVDLTAYKSILIHCEKFTKLWGASPLHSE